ncbi:MAG: UvrD-helicase domain-containing protein [Deltaproteobacteria bacterium]|nr:UvrD-helicase domain-containing protein [Deltaproteobacteria bacterium]
MSGLNPPQLEAARHVDGPLLILAGAGSGKTRVITHRIAWLVEEAGIPPESILAVTFTNKAAAEMRERCEALMGAPARRLWLSTFHAAGVRILREYGDRLGLPERFVIYDDSDQRALMRRILRDLGFDEDAFSPRDALARIDQAKGKGQGPSQMEIGHFDLVGERMREVYVSYQEELQRAGAVDFGDLLRLPVLLLREHADVKADFHARLRQVMVDEYQDTNVVQYALLKELVGPDTSVVVVGDDDQSIYRWRGADISNILSFERDFPGAKVVRLEQNYRSSQTILDAAHGVIRHARGRKPKKLWTDAGHGEPIKVIACGDEVEEARWVAATVERLSEEYPLPEIAIFYRVNAQSRVLEDALRAARLPYHIVRGRSFYERAEIKDLIAYLRLALSPDSDADLLRVINTPRRGIGKKTVETLLIAARQERTSAYRALVSPRLEGRLADRARAKLAAFHRLIDDLHHRAMEEQAPDVIVAAAIAASGYGDALRAEDSDESRERLENLDALLGAATERSGRGASLADFLDEMALTSDADGQSQDEHRISLMTLHAAKGLEFDAVVIVGMEERTFPHSRAFVVGETEWDPEEMAEERRLCYVGFTRARKELVLTWARSRFLMGSRQVKRPSRFLEDIEPDLIDPACRPQRSLLEPGWSGEAHRQGLSGYRGRQRGLFDEDAVDPPAGDDFDALTDAAEALAEEVVHPEPGEVVVDYAFDQRPEHERGGGIPRRGGRVWHRTFGEGRIAEVDGRGDKARLTVDFEGVGRKKVIARFVEVI